MSHVGRVLTPPIFNHRRLSQWVVWILVLTFITKSVNNESASFVQKAHPYRAFLRNHIRTSSQSSFGSHSSQSPYTSHSAYRSENSYNSHSTYRSKSSDGSQSVPLVNQSQHARILSSTNNLNNKLCESQCYTTTSAPLILTEIRGANYS